MTGILLRKREAQRGDCHMKTETQREGGDQKVETELGVMHPQAGEHLGPPEARKK